MVTTAFTRYSRSLQSVSAAFVSNSLASDPVSVVTDDLVRPAQFTDSDRTPDHCLQARGGGGGGGVDPVDR